MEKSNGEQGHPSLQISKQTFKSILRFNNDGDIVYANESIRVFCN